MAAVCGRERIYVRLVLPGQSLPLEGTYVADMLQSWLGLAYVIKIIFVTIKMRFVYIFLLVFSTSSPTHQAPVTLIFDVRFFTCVVERQLTQSARSLVSCRRSSRTGRHAALLGLLGCDKNRCLLPQFIDLLELHAAALCFKWPAVHSFSAFLCLHDYRLCNNSTLHTRSGFSVLYWVILRQYE
jgi:hypothetical protein